MNIIMRFIYLLLSPLYLFLGIISSPKYDGFLGIIGWFISVFHLCREFIEVFKLKQRQCDLVFGSIL